MRRLGKKIRRFNNNNIAKNTVISPNFLAWKFCGKEQFPHSFGRFACNFMTKALRKSSNA